MHIDFTNRNCVVIGTRSGIELKAGEHAVIIGDDIEPLQTFGPNITFLGSTVAIGDTVFGKPCNLRQIILEAQGLSPSVPARWKTLEEPDLYVTPEDIESIIDRAYNSLRKVQRGITGHLIGPEAGVVAP